MFAAKINITCHGNARMRDTPTRSAFRRFRRVVRLAHKTLLHGRCQYDEYVSLFLHIGLSIHLRVFIFQLYAQNEGALQAETPGEGSGSRLIIDGDHVFVTYLNATPGPGGYANKIMTEWWSCGGGNDDDDSTKEDIIS